MKISGENLKVALRIKGLSQESAASLLQISRQTLVNRFKEDDLDFDFVQKIKRVLQIDLNLDNGLGEEFHSKGFDAPKSINGMPHNDKIAHLKNLERQVRERHTPAVKGETSHLGIPMYNFPGSASNIEMYQDENDVKIIGYLKIPGAVKNSFSLPVHGHSMYPYLANGNWCILREVDDPTDIDWGQVYYIEYGNYRTYKRLLHNPDDPDTVILWSDNQTDMINGRPIYAPKTIKIEKIRRLCLLTDILQKPNY